MIVIVRCVVHVSSQDFYCLSHSFMNKTSPLSFLTACCCIISIIHKACACNLILNIIFTAAKSGPRKVKLRRTFRCLSMRFVAHSSSILCMRLENNKQTLYAVWDSHFREYQPIMSRIMHSGALWRCAESW